MFQLSNEETENWKSQLVITNPAAKMAIRNRPYAFTEQGVAMLSSVLHSDRAIAVNIAIMRAFVKLRQVLASHRELARKIEQHDEQIAVLFDTVQKLLAPPHPRKKNPIGYITPKD
jgi:hypothetical protein